jgi:hypothetical protein
MSPEAERVWTASEDYTVLAKAYLEAEHDRSPKGNTLRRSEEYRVCFLFPNLPERSRQDLCRVRGRFLGVSEAQRAEREQPSQGAASGAEHREADAVAFQRDAQDACGGFSRVQQEILREKFFVRVEP